MGDVFRRGEVWYTHVFVDGKRKQVSTRCKDRKAALVVATQLEREAADPEAAIIRSATLGEALKLYLKSKASEVKAGKLSGDTHKFYTRKVGHLARLLEHDSRERYRPMKLSALKAATVDAYIEDRRDEGVTDHTIKKELIALQGALKLAKRRGLWRGDVDTVMPQRFSPNYKPRKRALTQPELQRLLANLPPDSAARVAYCVATSAEWGATVRALREDVDLERMEVLVRGTKRPTRWRTVPVIYPPQQALLRYAMEWAEGTDGMLFGPWSNARRDLQRACDDAGIERCCFNDLRRTATTWLRAAGVPLELLSLISGHSSTRMLEMVYARLTPEQLGLRMANSLGLSDTGRASDCSAYASDSAAQAGLTGLSDTEPIGLNEKTPPKAGSAVPRDRIELPTRGFSNLVSLARRGTTAAAASGCQVCGGILGGCHLTLDLKGGAEGDRTTRTPQTQVADIAHFSAQSGRNPSAFHRATSPPESPADPEHPPPLWRNNGDACPLFRGIRSQHIRRTPTRQARPRLPRSAPPLVAVARWIRDGLSRRLGSRGDEGAAVTIANAQRSAQPPILAEASASRARDRVVLVGPTPGK